MSLSRLSIMRILTFMLSSCLLAGDMLMLKTGQDVEFQISEVHQTALLDETSYGIKLSLIDIIVTDNKDVLNQLLELYPQLNYKKFDAIYSIEIGGVVIPELEVKPFDPLEYQHILINLITERTSELEMSLTARPWFDKKLLLDIGASYGRWGSDPRFSSSNFHFGVGFSHAIKNRRTDFLMVFHAKKIEELLEVPGGMNGSHLEAQNTDLYFPSISYFGFRILRQGTFGEGEKFKTNYGLQIDIPSKVPEEIYTPLSLIFGLGYNLNP